MFWPKTITKFLLLGGVCLSGLFCVPMAEAGLVFTTESGTHEQSFTLDTAGVSTDFVDLEFGSDIDARLRYDVTNNDFTLNRDTDFGGNEIQNVRIESLALAPACNAGQAGRFYFNTADSVTYVCNGLVWSQIENTAGSSIALPVVQARRTATYVLTTSYVDIDLDTTDAENNPGTLDHNDILRDRVEIGTDGLYQVIYGYTAGGTATANHEARARVRANDATVLEGSQSVNRNYQGEYSTTSASFLATLTAGDFISLQLQRNATIDATQDDIFFSVVKLEGVKGEDGNDGSTDENVFIIDNDDTGGDVVMQFGATLNESLTWEDANTQFSLSDDLDLSGNELKDFKIENLSASPTCDGTAIGRQYYDTDDNEIFTCDGIRWVSHIKTFHQAGRAYMYADERWVTWSHGSIGTGYYNWNQTAGTAADPSVPWNGQGLWLPKDAHVSKVEIVGRANNTEVTEVEHSFEFRYPNPTTRWGTGIDNNAEDLHVEVYRNFWWDSTDVGQPDFTTAGGNINDIHRRTFDFDYTTPEDGWLDASFKPTRSGTTNRYFSPTIVINYTTSPQ